MKVTLYLTSADAGLKPATNGGLLRGLLENQNIGYETIVDRAATMKVSRGHCNPADGAIVVFDDVVCYDIFKLVEQINKHGLKLC